MMIMPNTGEKAMLGYTKLLRDECKYEKYSSQNQFNEKSYESVKTIPCFVSYDFTNDRNYLEQNIVLTKKIFIGNDFEPHTFDKFDGLEVKHYKPVKGLLTGVIGWEIAV